MMSADSKYNFWKIYETGHKITNLLLALGLNIQYQAADLPFLHTIWKFLLFTLISFHLFSELVAECLCNGPQHTGIPSIVFLKQSQTHTDLYQDTVFIYDEWLNNHMKCHVFPLVFRSNYPIPQWFKEKLECLIMYSTLWCFPTMLVNIGE